MATASIKIKKPFKNEYISVSRIKLYEKCALAFAYSYVLSRDRKYSEPAEFGKLEHSALENIYNWICAEEFSGRVPDEVINEQYVRAFEASEVTGTPLYTEGLKLVRDYFRLNSHVLHTRVLAVEKKFVIRIGDWDVLGYIDRIDRIDHESILIVDYKTNRMLFTREELDSDLQVSIYGLAVRELYPWVREVKFAFDMLRHGVRQYTTRTAEQLQEAADYMVAMAKRIESSERFEAKLNTLCGWCDHRGECPEYQGALENGEGSLSSLIAKDDRAEVCKARERAAALEKIAKGRKNEMDRIILGCIRTGGEFVEHGMRYKSVQKPNFKYDTDELLEVIEDGLKIPRDEIVRRVMAPQKGLIEELMKKSKLTSGKKKLLMAKIESAGESVPQRPFVSGRKVAERKGDRK